MLQNKGGKFIPNKFLQAEDQEYTKAATVKGAVKLKASLSPLKERTNQIPSMMHEERHQKLVLYGLDDELETEEVTLDSNNQNRKKREKKGTEKIEKTTFSQGEELQ